MEEEWLLHAHECPSGAALLIVTVDVLGEELHDFGDGGDPVLVPYGDAFRILLDVTGEVDGRVVLDFAWETNGDAFTRTIVAHPGQLGRHPRLLPSNQRFRLNQAGGGDPWLCNLAWISRARLEGRS